MTAAHATGHVRIVRRQRGEQVYIKFRCPTGTQVQKCLGPLHRGNGRCPDGRLTRRMAEAELQAQLNRCDRGECDHRGVDRHTFGAACREWLRWGEQEAGWALTNRRNNRSSVNARVIPFFGDETPINDMTTARIDEYRVYALVERKLARSTVQGDLAHLSGILGRAKRLKWIATNPYDEAERIKTINSGDFNVLSVVEVEAVARATADQQTAALIRFAAYTGLRQGELRALRWRDIDFANATVHVRRSLPAHGEEKIPKGKRVRSLPLWDQAAAAVERLSRRGYLTRPDDRVFASPAAGALDDGSCATGSTRRWRRPG